MKIRNATNVIIKKTMNPSFLVDEKENIIYGSNKFKRDRN